MTGKGEKEKQNKEHNPFYDKCMPASIAIPGFSWRDIKDLRHPYCINEASPSHHQMLHQTHHGQSNPIIVTIPSFRLEQ